jgi:hypothetical protein
VTQAAKIQTGPLPAQDLRCSGDDLPASEAEEQKKTVAESAAK